MIKYKFMITDLEKKEIFENTPFFYTSIQFNELNLKGALGNNFETVKDFKKMLFSENTRTFFRNAITIKNSEEFIKHIDNEFELFNIYNAPTTELKIKWLQSTYNYIVNKNDLSGFINKPTVVAFVKWYNITLNDLQPQQNKVVEPKKRKKTLFEFIHKIEDKEAFLNDLKNTFPNEIGLSIKAIVIRLSEVKILIYGPKEFKNFYDELTKYFDRNIGTYVSINDNIPDSKITGTINEKLNPLIDKYKTT